jgi:hypothetical protein
VPDQLDADDQQQHGHDHGVLGREPGLEAVRAANASPHVDDAGRVIPF